MPHHLPTPRLGRAAAVLAATFAAGAIAAPQASALSVERSLFNGTQTVRIDAGNDTTDVANQLTVTPSDDELVITDTKATIDQVGPGCTKVDAHNATCPATGTGEIRALLGDGDDSFFATQLGIRAAVWGDGGTDTIFTGGGNDSIYDGNFSVNTAHHDLYSGGGGNDEFRVAAYGNDSISGGEGSDTADFAGSNAAVTVSLDGVANDGIGAVKKSNVSVEHVVGTNAGDTLTGSGAANKLSGGPGDDTIKGEGGTDTLAGDADDDVLAGGAAADTINGGQDRDTVDYSAAAAGVAVSLDLLANDGVAGEKDNVKRDVEDVKGSAHADTLVAWAADNKLEGNGGKDTLDGANGKDVLLGGADDDVIVDGPGGEYDKGDVITPGGGYDTVDYSARVKGVRYHGGDAFANEGEAGEGDHATEPAEHVIGGSGNDELSGSGGDDLLEGRGGDDRLNDWKGADVLDGGEGADLASMGTGYARVIASLDGVVNDGVDQNLDGVADEKNELVSIEGLEGGAGNDTLTGNSQPNRLEGGHGDDVIQARSGDDLLIGGEGADDLMGSMGNDTVSYKERTVGVVTTFGDGFNDGTDADRDGVSEENDAIRSTVENVIGSQGQDTLTGNTVANVLDGFTGNDTITGGAGADTLVGGPDADQLHGKGDATADTIDCGFHTDTATADAGLDTAKDCETVG